jgi:hypothetical protein
LRCFIVSSAAASNACTFAGVGRTPRPARTAACSPVSPDHAAMSPELNPRKNNRHGTARLPEHVINGELAHLNAQVIGGVALPVGTDPQIIT